MYPKENLFYMDPVTVTNSLPEFTTLSPKKRNEFIKFYISFLNEKSIETVKHILSFLENNIYANDISNINVRKLSKTALDARIRLSKQYTFLYDIVKTYLQDLRRL